MKKLFAIFLVAAGLLSAAPTQPIKDATLTGTTNLGSVGTIDNSTGNIATAGSVSTGSGSAVAGTLGLKQGTAPSVVANTVQHIAPTSVTGYNEVDEASVGVTGYYKGTVSGTTATKSKVSTIPAADVASGALANGMTATTQTAGSNDTKVATDAYADVAARATHLGTFASPNTAAGAITWTAPVYNIYTSAGSTRTYTLPAASSYSGQAFILNVAVGTGHVNVQPASGAQLVLAGVLLTADHYVQAATSAPGNYICFISDGTNWCSLGSSGTWADAASP